MSTKRNIDEASGIAVFVRNHRPYLDGAFERNKKRSDHPTTFRATKGWNSAHYALQKHKSLTCYMTPIGGDKMVEYQAVIHHIKLDPDMKDPETRTLLGFCLEKTKDEELWEDSDRKARTLYTITHCEKIATPFPMTELIKVTDEKPISKNYGYSYSLVYDHVPPPPDILLISPEEMPYEGVLYEGDPRKASITARQRSAQARKRCLENYGYDCTVCGFNFEQRYGDIGKGYIHVHHLTPLVKVEGIQKINPIEDLRPVCPNCHAMLHSCDHEVSIEELKKRLRSEHGV